MGDERGEEEEKWDIELVYNNGFQVQLTYQLRCPLGLSLFKGYV